MSSTELRKPRPRWILDGFLPDTRFVIYGVAWDDYERFVDSICEGEICRVAFDGKDIEMMTLGPWHESEKSLLEAFIAIVAGELKIKRQPLGSTTWKRQKLNRAIESDLCVLLLRDSQAGSLCGRIAIQQRRRLPQPRSRGGDRHLETQDRPARDLRRTRGSGDMAIPQAVGVDRAARS
jgi:hypothetical protein